jgi:hypothetical protein
MNPEKSGGAKVSTCPVLNCITTNNRKDYVE